MRTYEWKATYTFTHTESGVVDADSPEEVRAALREHLPREYGDAALARISVFDGIYSHDVYFDA